MNDNRCVCCGRIIPEGRQVCPMCEEKAKRRDIRDYWLNEWIFPIGIVGLLIAAGIYILRV